MKVFNCIDDIYPDIATVVSTGTFDGVHLGHKTILNELLSISQQKDLQSVVVTFHPHPRIVLGKDAQKLLLLTSLDEKISILEELGVDNVIVIPFDKEFASMPYENYVKDFLVGKLGAKHVVLGFNHHFGDKRTGNHETLMSLGKHYGYDVIEVSPQGVDEIIISSTRIRQLLIESNLDLANKLLGYHYIVSGTVIHGHHLGAKLGFPTANLSIKESFKLLPAVGVYAVTVKVDNRNYKGMCSIGHNPTFGQRALSVEANIFDFNEDIYGQEISVGFVSFLRQERKFNNVEALVRQLNIDKEESIIKLAHIHV